MGLRHLSWAILLALGCTAVHAEPAAGERFAQAAQAHRQGDYRQALQLWQQLAEQGQRDAQYNLGLMYRYADGVPQDLAAAMKWYKRAAEQGDLQSQYEVGLMYQEGVGVAADQAEAHRWFTMNRQHHYHHLAHNPQLEQWRR
ncbi:tetratricopeptide repeat protein [Azospira sp. APE16]|uniref:tetratricopeptide repeat protein n=1 Tax=Azospira sp. APE16 TaxID=3394231 RepID=UPI003A4DE53E